MPGALFRKQALDASHKKATDEAAVRVTNDSLRRPWRKSQSTPQVNAIRILHTCTGALSSTQYLQKTLHHDKKQSKNTPGITKKLRRAIYEVFLPVPVDQTSVRALKHKRDGGDSIGKLQRHPIQYDSHSSRIMSRPHTSERLPTTSFPPPSSRTRSQAHTQGLRSGCVTLCDGDGANGLSNIKNMMQPILRYTGSHCPSALAPTNQERPFPVGRTQQWHASICEGLNRPIRARPSRPGTAQEPRRRSRPCRRERCRSPRGGRWPAG